MNINSAYPSKYLAATADFPDDADLILTIKDVTVENVGQGADAEDKPIIYFQEVKKGFLCNRTNSKTIANLYGAETDAWIGKKIALYPTEVEYRGDMVMGIRVRIKAPAVKPAAAPSNGHAAKDELTLPEALAELAKVGLGKEELRSVLPEKDGKRTYSPSRDSDKVRELVLANTPPAEEVAF